MMNLNDKIPGSVNMLPAVMNAGKGLICFLPNPFRNLHTFHIMIAALRNFAPCPPI